jgi:hypothetical protein
MAAWGLSIDRFLIQHQQTSLNERLLYVRLQFSRLSCDDDGFSPHHNKGHQTDAYESTHHMLVLLFNTISYKVIGHKELDDLKACMIKTMCMPEMCFPPSFFDMQEHLMIHLVHHILTLDPLYLHSMFSYERFLAVLKDYVKNCAHSEGSIMEGYTIEEVVVCCADYVKDERRIGLLIQLHEGRLRGRGRIGQKTFVDRDYNLVGELHFSVLQQLEITKTYIDKHLSELRRDNTGCTDV